MIRTIDISDDLMAACQRHGISLSELRSPARHARLVRRRHAVWYDLHVRGWSYLAIGLVSDRDHSTVMHGIWRAMGNGAVARSTARKRALVADGAGL